jgi:hypothetical protein
MVASPHRSDPILDPACRIGKLRCVGARVYPSFMNTGACVARCRRVLREGSSSMHALREKVSAFVVSFNRAAIIGTCLRALRFADEVIVVDKSSTDETPAIAARHADRVITVPWSPTADETRAFALAQCAHEWIVFVDDDECLSPEAVQFIQAELAAPRADIYSLPLRHYILGTHDERAY